MTAPARLAAISVLAGRPRQQVRNRLALLLDKNADGAYVEPDESVRAAAAAAVMDLPTWHYDCEQHRGG